MRISLILFFLVAAVSFQQVYSQEFAFEAMQTAGVGKAIVKINIIEPSQTTGDYYRVTFTIDEFGNYFYSVKNLNTQITLVDARSVETSSTFEGVQISVDIHIPQAQIDEIVEVAHAGVAVEPPVHVFRHRDRQGRGGNNSTGEYTFICAGGGSFEAFAGAEANTLGNDYEIRFDGNPVNRNYLVYAAWRAVGTIPVPFSVWNIGKGTPDDTSDDRQILAIARDIGTYDGVYGGGVSPSDGGPGDMYDWIYVFEINPDAAAAADFNSDGVVDYDDFLLDLQNNGGDLSSSIFGRPYTGARVIQLLSLVNLTSNPSYVPPPGTIIRINTTKLPTEQNVFEFATPDFELYTSTLTINFGSVVINSQFSLSLPIINSGNSAINISSIDLGSEHFSLATSNFSISPGDTVLVDISFEPKELGPQSATMTINSNDAAFPQYVLALEGEGLPPFEPGKINILSRFDIKVDGQKRNDVTDVWGYYDEASKREFALVGYGLFTNPPNAGLKIIDVTNPSRPFEAAHLNTVPGFDVKTWQHYAYTVNGGGGTGSVIDLTNPDDPQVVGTFPSTHNITIAENGYMYTGSAGGNIIYDLNPDPSNPTMVWLGGGPEGGPQIHDATIVGDVLYDFHGHAGTFFYDISNPASLNLLGEIQTPEIVYHHSGWPTKDGRYLYICDEEPLLQSLLTDITIWDISDFANPVLVNSISDPTATVHNLVIIGDYVYTSYYNAGFKVFDASDPVNPQLIYQYDTEPNVEGVGFNGAFGVYPLAPSGNVYVSDSNFGLFIFSSLDIGTSVSETTLPRKFTVYDNYPNPFNPATTISYDLQEAGHVKVSVYNALGQKIKILVDENQKAGSHRLQWDGTNNGGLIVTSGIYFYEIEAGDKISVKSMLFVK